MDTWQHNLDLLKKHLPAIWRWCVQHPERPADPEQESFAGDTELWFEQIVEMDWYKGLLLGFGDGVHVERLLRTYPERGLCVLEPEPDSFLRALHDRDLAVCLEDKNLQIILI